MPAELLYWDGTVERSVPVDGVEQVHSAIADVVDDKLGGARGFSLSDPSTDDSSANLAIAVDSTRWALIHTDDALDQHRTVGDSDPDTSIDVLFDEVTPIPRSWFITPASAEIAIAQWLTDRTLSLEIEWSDDAS